MAIMLQQCSYSTEVNCRMQC
uniref:Uncharacterized protein n=1 Tax=Arundo donax TaxID=35708 RepID=A0A0A9CAX3_ARUDO